MPELLRTADHSQPIFGEKRLFKGLVNSETILDSRIWNSPRVRFRKLKSKTATEGGRLPDQRKLHSLRSLPTQVPQNLRNVESKTQTLTHRVLPVIVAPSSSRFSLWNGVRGPQ